MADEDPKTKGEPGVADKLKELEQNLAKELDIAVETSGVGGMGAGKAGVTSATIQTPTPPKIKDPTLTVSGSKSDSDSAVQTQVPSQLLQGTESGKSGTNLQATDSKGTSESEQNDDMSNSALDVKAMDEILYANNKDLKSEIEGLEGELGKVKVDVHLESSHLGEEFLKPEGEESHSKEAPEKNDGKVRATLKGFLKAAIGVIVELIKTLPVIIAVIKEVKSLPQKDPKAILAKLIEVLTPKLKVLQEKFKKLFAILAAVRPRTYLEIIIAIILGYGVKYWLSSGIKKFIEPEEADPYITDYLTVGKDVKQVENTDSEDIDNPAAHPEYSVYIKRILANLKPEKSGRLPLVSLEVYLEASNQETAIEIKDREKEIHHYISRAAETMTFEELDSIAGKNKLKLRIKIFVNPLLTKGRVNRVYYKSLQITQ